MRYKISHTLWNFFKFKKEKFRRKQDEKIHPQSEMKRDKKCVCSNP